MQSDSWRHWASAWPVEVRELVFCSILGRMNVVSWDYTVGMVTRKEETKPVTYVYLCRSLALCLVFLIILPPLSLS